MRFFFIRYVIKAETLQQEANREIKEVLCGIVSN